MTIHDQQTEEETEAMLSRWLRQRAEVLAQRDELLEALKISQDYLGGPWTAPEEVIERCRAAIARAESDTRLTRERRGE